ncbi:Hpt domain-containing protein [Ponticoccus litoralis]|uniref:Hpt domain-containing protein n=1 Tax=Ponticoccus litoralis TaxID=422297 RepID=A0AAW9SJR0_9RHOB
MIDWARVEALVDEVGAEDFGEIVDLFLTEVDTAVAGLEAAGDNPVLLAEHMHFLKGAALNLGFDALARACQKGETAAAMNAPQAVTAAELQEIYNQSRGVFERDLPGKLAA